jgi:uncharacterized membrane protein YbhN (UPF0104 family)
VILAVLAWRTDWHQVGEAFAHLRWGLWLLAVPLYVLTQVVSSLRWQWLSRPLGFDRPLRHYFAFYFIGMFFNLVLPTSVGGDVVRAWYLDGGSGRRLSAFLSVFVERLSGLMVLIVIACVADLLCPVPLPARIHWTVWGPDALARLGWQHRPSAPAGGRRQGGPHLPHRPRQHGQIRRQHRSRRAGDEQHHHHRLL